MFYKHAAIIKRMPFCCQDSANFVCAVILVKNVLQTLVCLLVCYRGQEIFTNHSVFACFSPFYCLNNDGVLMEFTRELSNIYVQHLGKESAKIFDCALSFDND